MNILYLANHLNVGGITSYLLTLAPGLKARGHTVYVASGGGEMIPRFRNAGIEHWGLALRTKQEFHPMVFISALKARGLVHKHMIDVVHSNTRSTQVAGCLIRRWTGAAHVSTCHGFFKPRLARRLFPCWGDVTIAISESVREHLVRDLAVPREKVKLIHSGVDVERFGECVLRDRAEYKRLLGVGADPVVGIVARLSDVKGHKHLIEAMKEVSGIFPSVRLLIVGEGGMERTLAGWADSLGLKERVMFIPSVSDTRDILCALDVFVMPSLHEGLGLALMEAMAAGCACVGSDVGGIKTLIEHEYNGLLVPPGNAGRIAAAIIRLLRDPRERESLGKQARVYIGERFTRDAMLEKTEEVYRCVSGKE